MESCPQAGNLSMRGLADGSADLDVLDEMLMDDGWLEFPDCSDIFHSGSLNVMSPFSSLSFSPLFEVSSNGIVTSNSNLQEISKQELSDGSGVAAGTSFGRSQKESRDKIPTRNSDTIGQIVYSVHSGELHMKNSSLEPSMCWRVQTSDLSSSVKDRFLRAINYIRDSQRDADVLVQLWVPVKKEEQLVLTTYSQPFSLSPNCEKLEKYRVVSGYYQFPAEENSGDDDKLSLPSRVFLRKVPEWTPDVQYFNSFEFRRVNYAQIFDVRGTIAFPVFEKNGHSCLGVVEVVMTTQKINYLYEVDNICSALQAVDLRTSEILTIPRLKITSGSYQTALPEILEVLQAICKMHMLPLAQTWIPSVQQDSWGHQYSDKNRKDCICTVVEACYVNDLSVLEFHKACSEQFLFRGQGVAGAAFITNQPCFSSDITSYSNSEYPLSHHARMFNLKGAVAIRLRSTCTGTTDFVLELYLPQNCVGIEEQKLMLDTLSISVQNLSQTLRVVTDKELKDEAVLHLNGSISSDSLLREFGLTSQPVLGSHNVTLGRKHEMEISGELNTTFTRLVEDPMNQADLTTITIQKDAEDAVLPMISKLEQQNQDLDKEITNLNDFSFDDSSFPDTAKATKRKQCKKEKTVSLQVLQNYFAGSLKDAAKSLGVCPTTLKRICRMHGITRWPSRKIKKVDHSLKKLQVVIDSVHGADNAIQLSSLYKDFSMSSASHKIPPNAIPVSSPDQMNDTKIFVQQQDNMLSHHHHSSSSHSSIPCSQKSSSSLSYSSEEKNSLQNNEKLLHLSQANGNAELNLPPQAQTIPDSFRGPKSLGDHSSSASLSQLDGKISTSIRIKVMFGSDKVRLRLQYNWGFEDLKHEILKRFNLVESNSIKLKYLDDDSEWILLTCDADLSECVRIHKLSSAQTIKFLLQPIFITPSRNSGS